MLVVLTSFSNPFLGSTNPLRCKVSARSEGAVTRKLLEHCIEIGPTLKERLTDSPI